MGGDEVGGSEEFEIHVYGDLGKPLANGNVDVEVLERDGKRWAATFFTLENLEALFVKNAVTGECAEGTYFWASDMIVVRLLSMRVIQRTIRDLRSTGEFSAVFGLLSDGDEASDC